MTDRIKISDFRDAGYCVKGIKKHCEAVGVDFKSFAKNGVPITEAEKIDDEIVRKIIAIRRNIENG